MKPRQLLDAAQLLVDKPSDATGGLWARAATILTRQALEECMAEVLTARAPGSQAARFDAQLLILGEVLHNRELATRIRYTWSALSAGSHQQGHELPPTADELRDWIAAVDELVGAATRSLIS